MLTAPPRYSETNYYFARCIITPPRRFIKWHGYLLPFCALAPLRRNIPQQRALVPIVIYAVTQWRHLFIAATLLWCGASDEPLEFQHCISHLLSRYRNFLLWEKKIKKNKIKGFFLKLVEKNCDWATRQGPIIPSHTSCHGSSHSMTFSSSSLTHAQFLWPSRSLSDSTRQFVFPILTSDRAASVAKAALQYNRPWKHTHTPSFSHLYSSRCKNSTHTRETFTHEAPPLRENWSHISISLHSRMRERSNHHLGQFAP